MDYQQSNQRSSGQYIQSQSPAMTQGQLPPNRPNMAQADSDRYTRGAANSAHYSQNQGLSGQATHPDELHLPSQDAPYPQRSTSYINATSGGHYQSYGQSGSYTQPQSYNPQQYGAPAPNPRPPAQYSPQLNNTTPTFATNFQSYNPAAYHQSGQTVGAQPPLPPPPRPYSYSYDSQASPASPSTAQLVPTTAPLPYRGNPPGSFAVAQNSSNGYPYATQAAQPSAYSNGQDDYTSQAASQRQTSYPPPRHDRRTSIEGQSLGHRPLPPIQYQTSSQTPHSPSSSLARRPVASHGSLPQTPTTPGPAPPGHAPQRNDTVGRHPQARPLPGPPPTEQNYFTRRNGQEADYSHDANNDELMQEVEAAVMGRPPPSSRRRSDRDSRPLPNLPAEDGGRVQGFHRDRNSLQANGNVSQPEERDYLNSAEYDDDSDAEAEAGLAAMRSAEQQEAAEAARRTSSGPSDRWLRPAGSPIHRQTSPASSDGGVTFDMASMGGGFTAPYHYGDGGLPGEYLNYADHDPSFASTRFSQRSNISNATTEVGHADYPNAFAPARVDTGDTGGLSEPSARPRRLSFEDGDEATLADTNNTYTSDTAAHSRDGLPEMFFYPSSAGGRPLPAAPMDQSVPQLMPAGTYKDPEKLIQYDEQGRPRFPVSPDAYAQSVTPSGTPVPRSSSLMSHPSQPQPAQPIRSKTDADRARVARQAAGLRSVSGYSTDAYGDAAFNPNSEMLDLPVIPNSKRRRFTPEKLSSVEYQRCPEPWALSSIVDWLREMTEGEADLKEHAVAEGLVKLFTGKVPTMNTADAESLSAKVVRAMLDAGTLIKEEEWVRIGSEPMSGVLFQLTGTGCYSSKVHVEPIPGRCYSHHCMRTLKKVNLQLEPPRKIEDWQTFYGLKKDDFADIDRKEIELQFNLHEIVTSEEVYMDTLNVIKDLYRKELDTRNPPIIAGASKQDFLREVFDPVNPVKQANEEYLLPQLKYRQQEQGPYITGFSDIFREWIRKAKAAYLSYAAGLPKAIYLVHQELDRNVYFHRFLDEMQSHERSRRLDWQNFVKAPVTRLQRYGLLLDVVYRHMTKDSEEKANLAAAIKEIKAVTSECDSKFDEMQRGVKMMELSAKLRLRQGMEAVKLNLTHLGREIIKSGDVQRLGSARVSWLDAHAILFDHYFVLAKISEGKPSSVGGEKFEFYDVSKLPIPMDLLVLESRSDDAVSKSTMKGLGGVANKAGIQSDYRPGRQSNGSSSPALNHTDTSTSSISAHSKGLSSTTTIDASKEEKLLYPFKIRHLGRPESYALYATSKHDRDDWCNKIIQAKTRHAESLYKQNAEPFRLRVIADTAFAYDAMTTSTPGILIKGTPLHRAIREVEKAYEGSGQNVRPNPVCRASVNCAAAFTHPNGTKMFAVGTDYGVYISSSDNPRGWTRVSRQLFLPSKRHRLLTNTHHLGRLLIQSHPNRRIRRIFAIPAHQRKDPYSTSPRHRSQPRLI